MKHVLIIAAHDTSGGAGVTRDVRIAEKNGCWPLTAVTGLTIQNADHLSEIIPVSEMILKAQLEFLKRNYVFSAVKIGALCDPRQIGVLREFLACKPVNPHHIVLDPVFAPTRGREFLRIRDIEQFRGLLSLVGVVTPNQTELGLLSGSPCPTFERGVEAARTLMERYGCSVYVKGGHYGENPIREAWVKPFGVSYYEKPRVDLSYTHGTGCVFSTQLACFLAGDGLRFNPNFPI